MTQFCDSLVDDNNNTDGDDDDDDDSRVVHPRKSPSYSRFEYMASQPNRPCWVGPGGEVQTTISFENCLRFATSPSWVILLFCCK